MADITKTAFSSNFYYPEIVYNDSHVIGANATLVINHDLGYVPFVRIWGELYPGEYSSVWASSAQYLFNFDYENKGIWGYRISFNSNALTIESFNNSSKRVYVRMYKNE